MNDHQRPPTIAAAAAERWQRMAPAAAPWLHEEVGRRMEERLQWIKRQPTAWADWGAVRGGLGVHRQLRRRYPWAAETVVEERADLQLRARQALVPGWWRRMRGRAGPVQVVAAPAAGSVQLLWANMQLHMAADPQALIARWHAALAADGFLMFSCLGPDTVRELHGLYQALGWPPPGHALTDMHDWGDMLVQGGFAEPVMDMERLTLTYESPRRLLEELRELGRNLHPARFAALRGRGFRNVLEQALAHRLADPAQGGRLALTFEIVYGHAFKPPPRARLGPQTAVPLADMRAMLQRGPARPG